MDLSQKRGVGESELGSRGFYSIGAVRRNSQMSALQKRIISPMEELGVCQDYVEKRGVPIDDILLSRNLHIRVHRERCSPSSMSVRVSEVQASGLRHGVRVPKAE